MFTTPTLDIVCKYYQSQIASWWSLPSVLALSATSLVWAKEACAIASQQNCAERSCLDCSASTAWIHRALYASISSMTSAVRRRSMPTQHTLLSTAEASSSPASWREPAKACARKDALAVADHLFIGSFGIHIYCFLGNKRQRTLHKLHKCNSTSVIWYLFSPDYILKRIISASTSINRHHLYL